MDRKVTITIDYDKCVGNAMCAATTPKVFTLNKNRQSSVANANGDTWERILDAAQNCPVSAITIRDAKTNQQLHP